MPEQLSFLQTNVNHSAGAQDLLLQSMVEWQVDLAVACEPYYVPPLPHWLGDSDETVAVLTRSGTGPPFSLIERGSGYVVVGRGEYIVVGTYFSPNRSLAEFETYLGLVRAAVARQSPKPIVVLGDLNAKSRAWGNPATNPRGRAVLVWALLSDLSLLNRGQVQTCVRHQGGFVVDVSFATPMAARRVVNWRVEEEFRTQGAPVTETMPPELLLRLVGELFPHPGGHVPPQMAPRSVIEDAVAPPLITEREMEMALSRLRAKNTAPELQRFLSQTLHLVEFPPIRVLHLVLSSAEP
ncbi:uncharacterized protein LOC124537049 [Vanessa cardui]|uniref:uncharacterized protein LOC124537049 n=1 Tax=Vanessa cardui TaxID=171605 RepID=UPI001F147E17|nr:uncharacterized protein LOC124537049 [Vanessa cardui]